MNRIFSVFALAARSTIYKIIGVLLFMATIEITLFISILKKLPTDYPFLLEEVVVQSKIPFICAIAFLAICAILSLWGVNRSGSKITYTINRLSINEKTTATLWAIYNIFCFFIFWAIQLIIILFLCKMYLRSIDSLNYSTHTVFISFYQNKFMHSLLPLDEISRYIRNIILIFGLGFSCSYFSLKHRRNEKSFSFIVLAIISTLFFAQEVGSFSSDLFIIIISLIYIASSIYYIWWGEQIEE